MEASSEGIAKAGLLLSVVDIMELSGRGSFVCESRLYSWCCGTMSQIEGVDSRQRDALERCSDFDKVSTYTAITTDRNEDRLTRKDSTIKPKPSTHVNGRWIAVTLLGALSSIVIMFANEPRRTRRS